MFSNFMFNLLVRRQARRDFFSSGLNKESLHAIEKAAFVLILDDESQAVNIDNPDTISAYGRSLLHGKCYDR